MVTTNVAAVEVRVNSSLHTDILIITLYAGYNGGGGQHYSGGGQSYGGGGGGYDNQHGGGGGGRW